MRKKIPIFCQTFIALTLCFILGCASVFQPSAVSQANPMHGHNAQVSALVQAFDNIDFKELKGRKVFLDTKCLNTDEKEYIHTFLKAKFIHNGITLVDDDKSSELKVLNLVRITDYRQSLVSINGPSYKGDYACSITVVDSLTNALLERFDLYATSVK
jgi:hypothetical protein